MDGEVSGRIPGAGTEENDPRHEEVRMSKVEESIEVDVPVSTVYNQWTQFEQFPRFMDGVERIEQRTPTLTHWVATVDGVRKEFDAQITEKVPDERVAWTTVGGDVHQAGVVTVHRLSEGRTKVMLQLEHDPQGLIDKLGDKLGFVRRQAKNDLRHFKTYIEERGTETGTLRGTV